MQHLGSRLAVVEEVRREVTEMRQGIIDSVAQLPKSVARDVLGVVDGAIASVTARQDDAKHSLAELASLTSSVREALIDAPRLQPQQDGPGRVALTQHQVCHNMIIITSISIVPIV